MKPGTIIRDIEGYDVGQDGAVVVSVDNDVVQLVRLDNEKPMKIRMDDFAYSAEEPVEPEGDPQWGYDEEALDSPELHTIRWLPTFWGPRDPNNPSSLTDVMYRPEPYWRRQVHRHYQDGEDVRMTYKRQPLRRSAIRMDEQRRRIDNSIEEIPSSFVTEILSVVAAGLPDEYADQIKTHKTRLMERERGSWGLLSSETWNVSVLYYDDTGDFELDAAVFGPQQDYEESWDFHDDVTTGEMGRTILAWLLPHLDKVHGRRASKGDTRMPRTIKLLRRKADFRPSYEDVRQTLAKWGSDQLVESFADRWERFPSDFSHVSFLVNGIEDRIAALESINTSFDSDVYREAIDDLIRAKEEIQLRYDEEEGRRDPFNHASTRDTRMTYRGRSQRTAEPLPWMDPVPRPHAQQRRVQTDYGLPRQPKRKTAVTDEDIYNLDEWETDQFDYLIIASFDGGVSWEVVDGTYDSYDAEDFAQQYTETFGPSVPVKIHNMSRHYDHEGPYDNDVVEWDSWSARANAQRTAEPLPWMDPVPRPHAQQRRVQTDYGLPRRMRLDRWKEEKDHKLDTEALIAHTIDFWRQYRSKRVDYMPEMGNHESTSLKDWGVIYQRRAGFEQAEIELLYRFMAATELIPHTEYLQFQDLLDSHNVVFYDRTDS